MPKIKLEPEVLPPTENVLLAVMVPRNLEKEIREISDLNQINRSQVVRWLLNKALRKPSPINLTLVRARASQ